MKLNYYTYTIKFKSTGITCKLCIKDIVDFYCKYQVNQKKLEKTNNKNLRVLYFAKAATYNSIYYLMTPTELKNYRKLDKSSGTIEDLKAIIGNASLEKVTYIHLDDVLPVIGIAPSHGGATEEDTEFYLNKIINGLSNTQEYVIELKPLNSGVAKSDIQNIKLLSEAKVLLRNDSSQFSKIKTFLNGTSNTDDLEIEIRVKRKSHSRINIKDQISPLLDIIKNDSNSSEFAEVFLRGKAHSTEEFIRDILLDQTMIIFDVINPSHSNSIESQIQDRRYANSQIDILANKEFSQYGTKLKTSSPCPKWDKLKDKSYY